MISLTDESKVVIQQWFIGIEPSGNDLRIFMLSDDEIGEINKNAH